MSFKPPSFLLPTAPNGLLSPLEIELAGEKADALARAGRKAEEALSALTSARAERPDQLEPLLLAAADAVFALMIQRELCGLRSQDDMVRRYGIPSDVMVRVGVTRKT